jgi:23S rRNA-/tRNA-specific pseudouridylate synthase
MLPPDLLPQLREPSILAKTEAWLVVDKPSGWLSVPGRSAAPVLLDWLRERHGREVLPIHRLDLETSGVLIYARSAEAHRLACGWFLHHRVRKRYEALAAGSPLRPVFRVATAVDGKPALSQVEVLERFRMGGFLASVRIETGRRHQVRAHLASLGFPLWGDPRYGGSLQPLPGLEVGRVALHARSLELPDGQVFEAPRPADFAGWLERARLGQEPNWSVD